MENFVLLIQGLHILLYLFFSLMEALHSSITLGYTPVQILIGLFRIKCIKLITGIRLVHVLCITGLIEKDTVNMGAATSTGFFLPSFNQVFGFFFLRRNPRDYFTFVVSLFRLLKLLVVVVGLEILLFMSCAPTIVSGL